jgi:hypothetical protein
MEKINLFKQVYPKKEVNNVINTNFTEFTLPTTQSLSTVSIDEFFNQYQTLFYQIPKFGETNSHEYLIKTSSEYIGSTLPANDTIQALIDEINQLRQENLDLQNQSISDSLQGAKNAIDVAQQNIKK